VLGLGRKQAQYRELGETPPSYVLRAMKLALSGWHSAADVQTHPRDLCGRLWPTLTPR